MRRTLFVLALVASAVVVGPRAQAACHFFTVGASSSVNEGDKVNVIIERDAAAAPSSVRVRTVNGTAKAPGDFTASDQRVEFTNETQKTVTISTKEDAVSESSEVFQVAVSDGEGCAVNPNFSYGDPASITIKDDDVPAPTTTKPPATTIIPANTRTPTPSSSPTPSASPTPTPSESASPSPTISATPVPVEEDGGFPWLPVLAVVGFAAAAAGTLIFVRMRGAGAG
jgi:hypothetical protein